MYLPPPLLPVVLAILLAILPSGAAAQAQSERRDNGEEDRPTLPEVEVRGQAIKDEAVRDLSLTKPTTTINSAELEMRNVGNVYDALRDVAGVAVEGGPRANAMKFSIRGYNDNEDVMMKIDGAVKGFEKYRYGSGLSIEPELVRRIEVERGTSLTAGSGKLGGTISATTKSALDLLKPGERFGALTKFGYGFNNNERLRMVSVFGLPHERIDLLMSITRRDSIDTKLPDGTRLPVSALNAESRLYRAGFMPLDDLTLEMSRVEQTSGPALELYDVLGGSVNDSFGVVRRNVDDQTDSYRLKYEPSSLPWLKMRATRAYGDMKLHDLRLLADNPTLLTSNYVYDWRYKITTTEFFADAEYTLAALKGVLTFGLQKVENQRKVVVLSDDPAENDLDFPGLAMAQPSGAAQSFAYVLDNAWTWGIATLTAGARWDRNLAEATDMTRLYLEREGVASRVDFSRVSPVFSLSVRPHADWTATIRQSKAFRPPLIDEYFTTQGYCNTFDFDDLTNFTRVCGGLYKPELATQHEYTLAWAPAERILGGQVRARATVFRIRTSNVLESIMVVNDAAIQPGVEYRRGTELELNYSHPRAFVTLSSANVDAELKNGGPNAEEVFDLPGSMFSTTVGGRWLNGRLEAGFRWRRQGDRVALTGPTVRPECGRLTGKVLPTGRRVAIQYGPTVLDLFASLRLQERTFLRFSVDNVDNEAYCSTSGFIGGIGLPATGRSVKVSLSMQF